MEIPTENSVPQNEMPIPMAVPLNNSVVEEVKDKRPLYLYGVIALVVYSALVFLDPKSVKSVTSLFGGSTAILMAVGLIMASVFAFYFSAKFLKIKNNNLKKAFFIAVSMLAIKTVIVFVFSKLIYGGSSGNISNFSNLAVGIVAGFIFGILIIRWTHAVSLGRSFMVWVVAQILSSIVVAILGVALAAMLFSGFN